MSILIKGMEMPKSCNECLMSIEYACMINGNIISNYWARLDRPTDCPLVPIPPHGRLIDTDALQKDGWKLRKEKMIMGGYSIQEMPLSYPLIPTIIEAEGVE